jgi:Flp pilus assembly protein TadD
VTIALARLYNRSGDFPKAEGVLSAQLRADQASIAVGTAMAQQYLATGRAQDAKKLFAHLVARQPNDVVALLGLTKVATTQRNWPEAVDCINRAHAFGPNDPGPGLALINLEVLRRDWKSVVTAATQVAEQFPANTDILDAKGRAQIASGDTAGAIATYKRIYDPSPSSIAAMEAYVTLLSGTKEFSTARTVLQDAKNDR